MATTYDLSITGVGKVVTITNLGDKTVSIPFSGMSQKFPLPAGDILKVSAMSSSELVGYLSLEDQAGTNIDTDILDPATP